MTVTKRNILTIIPFLVALTCTLPSRAQQDGDRESALVSSYPWGETVVVKQNNTFIMAGGPFVVRISRPPTLVDITVLGNEVGEVNDVAVQQDGKIVTVGYYDADPGRLESYQFAAVRLNSDGSLDESFGDGGGVVVPSFDYDDEVEVAHSVAIQPDGKIVLAGQTGEENYDTNHDFAVARLNSDGSLDKSFGDEGQRIIRFYGDADDFGRDVAIRQDGKIVITGYSWQTDDTRYDISMARLNPDGSTDQREIFRDEGIEYARDMALSPDETITWS